RKRLRQLSPEIISKSALLQYNREKNFFIVESFGHRIEITYPEGQVHFKAVDEKLRSFVWELILLNYLSGSREMPLKNEWVSYRDLPQGNVFYPNIRNNVIEFLGRFYSDCDKGLLRDALSKLGFAFVETKADLAAAAKAVPRVPVLIQFWAGEEEIPSSCQILFDSTVSDQMHIEDVAALCILIKDLIIEQYSMEKA
ncbi:MAG: hypothetical protein FD166_3754, partial [Bacteroidetes bacterium]